MNRRRYIKLASVAVTGALAGCVVRSEDMSCEGDCDLVEEWEADVEGSIALGFDTNVIVMFAQPFTGTVQATAHRDGSIVGGQQLEVSNAEKVTLTISGNHSTGSSQIVLTVQAADSGEST